MDCPARDGTGGLQKLGDYDLAMDPKRASFIEEEVQVKPSIELIPDEYEHVQNPRQKIILHTFTTSSDWDQENKRLFLETLKKFGYECQSENEHSLESNNFSKIISAVSTGISENDAGLIMFFSGFTIGDGRLQVDGNKSSVNIAEIWTKFTTQNCPQLKNKPKIFIFEVIPPLSGVRSDGRRYYGAYDTPAEADILVIFHKSTEEDSEYVKELCFNIETYAETENIITIASTIFNATHSVIISTLTRNFYFVGSDLRGHHLVIQKHHDEIKTGLKSIENSLEKKHPEKKEIFRGLLESFRIGKKSKTDDKKSSISSANKKTQINRSTSKISGIKSQTASTNLTGSRHRLQSTSEAEGRRPSLKNPPWKP